MRYYTDKAITVADHISKRLASGPMTPTAIWQTLPERSSTSLEHVNLILGVLHLTGAIDRQMDPDGDEQRDRFALTGGFDHL